MPIARLSVLAQAVAVCLAFSLMPHRGQAGADRASLRIAAKPTLYTCIAKLLSSSTAW
jgi:hypothetical protein